MAGHCAGCGASLDDDMKFCDDCGTAVGAAPAYPPDPQPVMYPMGPQQKTGKAVPIIVVAVLLLATVGAGLFFLLRQPDDPETPSLLSELEASMAEAPSPPVTELPSAPTSESEAPSVQEPETSEPEPATPDDPQERTPVFIPPQDVAVYDGDFAWFYVYEDSSGIPPHARVIGDDVTRLYGTWKAMILYRFEFEDLPSLYSCDIAEDAADDALLKLYQRAVMGPDGWVQTPGNITAEESCSFEDNLLRFYLEGVYMGLLFWEDSDCQYGVCHFEMDGTPGILMLMREL